MADENFNQEKESPQTIPAAFLLLNRNPPTAKTQDDILNIHPETMRYISEAAKITRASVIDFVFDSAWIRARKIIDKIDN